MCAYHSKNIGYTNIAVIVSFLLTYLVQAKERSGGHWNNMWCAGIQCTPCLKRICAQRHYKNVDFLFFLRQLKTIKQAQRLRLNNKKHCIQRIRTHKSADRTNRSGYFPFHNGFLFYTVHSSATLLTTCFNVHENIHAPSCARMCLSCRCWCCCGCFSLLNDMKSGNEKINIEWDVHSRYRLNTNIKHKQKETQMRTHMHIAQPIINHWILLI